MFNNLYVKTFDYFKVIAHQWEIEKDDHKQSITILFSHEYYIRDNLGYRPSQFLLNLMYKCIQAVCVFNKSQVDCFEMSMKDDQRQIDKIQLSQNDNNQKSVNKKKIIIKQDIFRNFCKLITQNPEN